MANQKKFHAFVSIMPMKLLYRIAIWMVVPLCLFTGQGQGQPVSFAHLDVANRLSQNSVLAITQDAQGFMWFGTREGLNKFDSRKVTVYKQQPGNKSSLSNSYILCLLTDSQGRLWIGTRNGLNRYLPDKDQFERIPFLDSLSPTVRDKQINCLLEDSQGRIWVGTQNTLYFLGNGSQPRLTPFNNIAANTFRLTIINCLYEESGILWVGSDQGLAQIRHHDSHYTIKESFHQEAGATRLVDNQVKSIVKDRHNNTWIGTAHRGLHRYDSATGSFRQFQPGPANRIASDHIRKLLLDKEGNLWIGTQEGLSLLNTASNTITTFVNDPWDATSLSQNSVHSLYLDKTGSIWVGTFFGGVNCYAAYNTPFTVYSTRSAKKLNNNVVSSIVQDNTGDLWVATEGGGLNRFGANGSITYYTHKPADPSSIGSNLVKVLCKDRSGNIWAGTHGGGLNLFDRNRNHFVRYLFNAADPYFQGAEIMCLLEDAQGNLWTGTETQGLQRYQRKDQQLLPLPTPEGLTKLRRQSILSILHASGNRVWVGTRRGLLIADNNGQRLLKYDTSLYPINCLYEDAQHRVWAGTGENGLIAFDEKGNQLKAITQNEGLPHNKVLGVIDDQSGQLWISTNNGLARYDPATGACNVYDTEDGLAGNVFNNNAWYKAPDGKIYLGGYQGLTAFDPAAISRNRQAPAIVFASLSLHNKEIRPGAPDGILARHIGLTSAISLRYNQNAFTIEFAALNFIKPAKNQYAYKLEGFDENFTYTSEPVANYTNVPPGTYTLVVKGSNNDGVWGAPISMKIRVLPPFWKTWWAYTLYTLAALTLVFFIARYFLLRALMKRKEMLTQFKLNFFTNISHEIRTHLALITGPAEKLISKTEGNTADKRLLQTIKANSESLLQLVNELMDFRKAETGHLLLHPTTADIVDFAHSIYSGFADIAAARNIEQRYSTVADHLSLTFDREQMEKVLYNLYSNAFKFTTEGGYVALHISQEEKTVLITVSNSGKGISPENVDRLFDNYFQEHNHGQQHTGYGIGLALSKSIVQAHKGSITVNATKLPDASLFETAFRVVLWKGTQHFTAEQLVPTVPSSLSHSPQPIGLTTLLEPTAAPAEERELASGSKPTILLVEDNKAIRTFIREALQEQYFIVETEEGAAGLAYAVEHIPDLIISDVMMPVMDGLEFCTRIKSDLRTSHIPVILLTAKTAVEYQISGLQTGANSYLTKPFSTRVLELQVQNHLLARKKYWQQFQKVLGQAALPPVETTTPAKAGEAAPTPPAVLHPLDEAFLKDIETIIYECMEDQAFGVAALAQKVAMSQPVLVKKLKAITGLSAHDFVKSLRLKRAAALLAEQRYTVYEIAYMVGYESSKYFSREFKKQYGVNPSEYVT